MNLPQIVTSNHAASVPTAITPLATMCLSNARARLAVLMAIAGLMLPAAASAQQVDGERLFRQRCGTCHSLETSQKRAGPHLSGVIGRAAGSVEGARYSAAMRESGIAWDSQSLDTFLAAPRQMVPGTSMTVSIPNAAQRAAIISYLENQGAGG